jgi:hypothetical protein
MEDGGWRMENGEWVERRDRGLNELSRWLVSELWRCDGWCCDAM